MGIVFSHLYTEGSSLYMWEVYYYSIFGKYGCIFIFSPSLKTPAILFSFAMTDIYNCSLYFLILELINYFFTRVTLVSTVTLIYVKKQV